MGLRPQFGPVAGLYGRNVSAASPARGGRRLQSLSTRETPEGTIPPVLVSRLPRWAPCDSLRRDDPGCRSSAAAARHVPVPVRALRGHRTSGVRPRFFAPRRARRRRRLLLYRLSKGGTGRVVPAARAGRDGMRSPARTRPASDAHFALFGMPRGVRRPRCAGCSSFRTGAGPARRGRPLRRLDCRRGFDPRRSTGPPRQARRPASLCPPLRLPDLAASVAPIPA